MYWGGVFFTPNKSFLYITFVFDAIRTNAIRPYVGCFLINNAVLRVYTQYGIVNY